MSLSYDIIKIRLHHMGYLPDYPYHLISDEEMLDAFLKETDGVHSGYFIDTYPCVFTDTSLVSAYNALVESMLLRINFFKDSSNLNQRSYIMPDWMQAYMLGSVVGPKSDVRDRHDLLVMLDCDNIDDEITDVAGSRCLSLSRQLLYQYSEPEWSDYPELQHRAPSVFGELNVQKALRISK